jgi:glycosyltransferase involved in cell wall biosynthesis
MLAGRAEGRLGRHDLGFQYDVIARMTPVGDRIATAAARARAARSQPAAALADRLGRLGDLHVTFSHDDYLAHSGGLQMCVRREAECFAQLGCDHLHLHPPTAWPTVRRRDEPGALGVMLNGRSLGVFTAKAIREALAGAVRPRARRSFAIHSLLGHEVDETADILAAAGLAAGYFWLHDFASLCAGFHLQRDDVEDCAAPPPDSAACGICVYGPQRARHLDAHRRLFERLALTVVAPSQTTLEFWRAHTDLSARDLRVLPHAELTPRGPAPATGRTRPFRLAYVGMPVPLKGWPVFRELAESLVGDSRYEFVHLGGRPDAGSRLAFQRVVVSGERPRAMQEKLEEVAADAALIWPLCRETFSFTAYEAAAAGAAVLTGPDSGNVAAFAADPRIGRVFADERALREAFVSGEILSLSRSSRRAVLYDLAFSGLSGDLVAEARA